MSIFNRLFNSESKSEKERQMKQPHVEYGYCGELYCSDNKFSIKGNWLNNLVYLINLDNLPSQAYITDLKPETSIMVIRTGYKPYTGKDLGRKHSVSELKSDQYKVYTLSDLKSVIARQIKLFNKSISDTNISIKLTDNNIADLLCRYIRTIMNYGDVLLPEPLISDINLRQKMIDDYKLLNYADMESKTLFDKDSDYEAFALFGNNTDWNSIFLYLIQSYKLDIELKGSKGKAIWQNGRWHCTPDYTANFATVLKISKLTNMCDNVNGKSPASDFKTSIPVIVNKSPFDNSEYITEITIVSRIRSFLSLLNIQPTKLNWQLCFDWYLLKLNQMRESDWQKFGNCLQKQTNFSTSIPEPLDFTTDFKSDADNNVELARTEMMKQGLDFTHDSMGVTLLQQRQVNQVKHDAEIKIRRIMKNDDYGLVLTAPSYNDQTLF